MNARIALGGRELTVDVSRPVSLAVPLDFAGPQPRHFGAPPPGGVGPRPRGGLDASRVAPLGLLPALLVTVDPEPAGATAEGSDPAPHPGDLLVTRRALERAWPERAPFEACALIVRTLPNRADKRVHDYSAETPPYLTREAAQLLVGRGIAHLIVDLPSVDR